LPDGVRRSNGPLSLMGRFLIWTWICFMTLRRLFWLRMMRLLSAGLGRIRAVPCGCPAPSGVSAHGRRAVDRS
jgi:hypothetical protein